MTSKRAIAILAVSVLLAGCANTSTPKQSFTRTGDPVVDAQSAVAEAPEKDRVLWQYRAGLTALRQSNYAEAQRMFDEALARVGSIIGTDKSARKARRMFSEEAKKT